MRLLLAILLALALGPSWARLPILPIKITWDQGNEMADVEVTGVGPTLQAARDDGVRQALQAVVPQLMSVERVVRNDEILRDEVLSSMNGHVRSVQMVTTERVADGVGVRLRLQIVRRDIVEFVSYRSNELSTISGAGLLAESAREMKAREFRASFLERLFRGYPSLATHVTVKSVRPDPSDPMIIRFEIGYQLDRNFVAALLSAARQLRCVGASESCSGYELCTQIDKDIDCVHLAAGPARGPSGWDGRLYPVLISVMGEPGTARAKPLAFAFRFMDETGARIGGSRCFDLLAMDVTTEREPPWARSLLPPIAPARVSGMRSRNLGNRQTYFVTAKPMTHVVDMSLATIGRYVDVSRVHSVQAVAVLGDDRLPRSEIVFDVGALPMAVGATEAKARGANPDCGWPHVE